MRIRSITYFLNPGWPIEALALKKAGDFIATARPVFEQSGFEVQTARLASIPFPFLLPATSSTAFLALSQALELAIKEQGYDYISLGPALPESPDSYALIPDILAATQDVFLSGVISNREMGVSLEAVRACAKVIQRAASLTSDGFANLRFAALANVPPGSPFFPAAYHMGDQPSFSLATEAASLAVEVFSNASNLEQARQQLITTVEENAQILSVVGDQLARQFEVTFGGIDFSLAPFPDEAHSLGAALERLGTPAVGMHGSLAAAAILADTLDRAQFKRAGFSGLFLTVLEDTVLAARAAEGTLTVTDLLLYSAVCGAGLDTLPLPGDITQEQLAAILLDLAALAQRLDKPLTARLMPIPGKQAGEPTGFNFPYFANSRVMAVRAAPLQKFLAGREGFQLMPRTREP